MKKATFTLPSTLRFVIVGACLGTLCLAQRPDPNAPQEALVNWLMCDECTDGEFETLRKVHPSPVAALDQALKNGPNDATRQDYTRRLGRAYDDLVEHSRTNPHARPGSSRDEFVQSYLRNFVRLYRGRAAEGLGLLGGNDAGRALRDAERQELYKPENQRDRFLVDTIRKALSWLG